MCIVVGTTFDNHAPKLNPTQDLKCTWCESTSKLKMMIEKNDHVISLKYFPQAHYKKTCRKTIDTLIIKHFSICSSFINQIEPFLCHCTHKLKGYKCYLSFRHKWLQMLFALQKQRNKTENTGKIVCFKKKFKL
jgi:hypothetical protein